MSVIEDTRKLLQDLIAPDLKALQTQVTSLEKRVDARFDSLEKSIDARFAAQEKSIDARFVAQEKSIDARFDAQERIMTAGFATQDAKLTALTERFLLMNDKLDAQREGAQADMRLLLANLGLLANSIQDVSMRLRHMESERERYASARNTPGTPSAAA